MEENTLFKPNPMIEIEIAERGTKALGHFLFPVFKKAAQETLVMGLPRFNEKAYPIFMKDRAFIKSFYAKCGKGAYMGIAHIMNQPFLRADLLQLSFFFTSKDLYVEEALMERLAIYPKREQFPDIKISLPSDWYFEKKDIDQRLAALSIDICLKKKKQTVPYNPKIFTQKIQSTKCANEVWASGIDTVVGILSDIYQTLCIPQEIIDVWR